jgi:hypothetical protein
MMMIYERHGDVRRQPPPDQITKNNDDTLLRLAEDDKFAQGATALVTWWTILGSYLSQKKLMHVRQKCFVVMQ